MDWELGENNPRTCEDCGEQFSKLNKPTPCGTCSKVRLLPENETAVQIFSVILSQLRVGGMGGVFGVDYASLPFLFSIYDVHPSQQFDTFERVQIMVSHAVKLFNAKKKK